MFFFYIKRGKTIKNEIKKKKSAVEYENLFYFSLNTLT